MKYQKTRLHKSMPMSSAGDTQRFNSLANQGRDSDNPLDSEATESLLTLNQKVQYGHKDHQNETMAEEARDNNSTMAKISRQSAHQIEQIGQVLSQQYSENQSSQKGQYELGELHPFLTYINDYPALAVPTYHLLSWDTSLCIHINRYSNYQRIADFFKSISRLGDGWFWGGMIMAALVIQLWSGMTAMSVWAPILTTLITSASGVALYKVLKVKTVRPRPYQVHQVIIMGERPLDVFSFPSGHTLQAVLVTCVLGGYVPILLWVMVPFAILVALSRMVLGLHYPTDVVVGAMIGAGLAQLSPFIYELLMMLVS